jgi:uncharacterized cupin superfamily protein
MGDRLTLPVRSRVLQTGERPEWQDATMRRVSISDPDFSYDPGDPEGFGSGVSRLGPQMEAQQTGASVYELPPGQAVCPYHYEYGEEEWVLVIKGRPSVRTPEGIEQLEPFDVLFFPKGPDGAHQIRNETDSPVRILMWSTVVYPTATAYPDSAKVGVWTGDKAEDVMVPRSARVGYFQGEAD